jgi:aspartate aminotransferase
MISHQGICEGDCVVFAVSSNFTAMPLLAARLAQLKPSFTAAFFQKAADLRARGNDIIGLGVGEPDFDTPAHIITAANVALANGHTRYTSVRGISTLRAAIARDSAARRGGVAHGTDEVIVSCGAKQALANLCFALLGEGDEAIVPTPCWVSYPEQCELAGARAVQIATRVTERFKLQPHDLARAITTSTRALFLCTPCNPTGVAYTADELLALAQVLREHDFWIVVDEIYSTLIYGGFEQRSLLDVAPDLKDRIAIVDGVSKRFAMTGFRIGWTLGPRRLIEACETIQSQTTTSATTVSQHAALAALEGSQELGETMRMAFEKRRALALELLRALPGVTCLVPDGAFYVLFDVRPFLGKTFGGEAITDDLTLAEALLERAGVLLMPGSAFLAPGYMRLSYAASEAQIKEGVARLRRFLEAG